MTVFTATEAKNNFGKVLDAAQAGPVEIEKNGRAVAVLLSAEAYAKMLADRNAPRVNPLVARLHEESVKRWGKVYEALAK